MKPFRWNLKKSEQLGRLVEGEKSSSYAEYENDLADCAAKIIARSANSRLVFIGRSPENVFDYLAGVLDGTSHESKLHILNISNRFKDMETIRKQHPSAYIALKDHFELLSLSPKSIVSDAHGVCFCDLVYSGGTFEQLFSFIKNWTHEVSEDFPSIIRKISFIGITHKTHNSPNTWRWQQHADWVKNNNKLVVSNISILWRLWDYLGNRQSKVSKTNIPDNWVKEGMLLPPREESHLKALRQAHDIYLLGLKQKIEFADRLALTYEVKQPWLRDLIHELKGYGK